MSNKDDWYGLKIFIGVVVVGLLCWGAIIFVTIKTVRWACEL